MKRLFVFRSFAYDSQRVLATVHQLAGVCVELFLNGGLRVAHAGIARELGIATFADSEHWSIPNLFHDSQLSPWHEYSLAPKACANETAPVPASSTARRAFARGLRSRKKERGGSFTASFPRLARHELG